jgi:hypothetical protein
MKQPICFKYHRTKLVRAYSTILLMIVLSACTSPPAPMPQVIVIPTETETLTLPSAPQTLTPTKSPIIVKTIPSTWTPAPTYTAIPSLAPGSPATLTHLFMTDENHGWGIDAGEHILHTTDGGQTWKDVTPHSGGYQDGGFFALDASTAWATSYQWYGPIEPNNASVWHTSDGGDTWQEQHPCLQDQDCGSYFDVRSVYYWPIALQFIDAQTGWLLVTVEHLMFQDRYRIYRTTDGGAHWDFVTDSGHEPWVNSVTGLAFQDQQSGWFTTSQVDGATDPGADWSLYQSTDAGATWNEVLLPEPDPLPEAFADPRTWCGADHVTILPPNAIGVPIGCKVYTDSISQINFYFHSMDGGDSWISWQ